MKRIWFLLVVMTGIPQMVYGATADDFQDPVEVDETKNPDGTYTYEDKFNCTPFLSRAKVNSGNKHHTAEDCNINSGGASDQGKPVTAAASGKVLHIFDKATDPWGIKVTNVEVKDVDLSEDLRKAMARQAEAERERRAKIIAAEGEFQAAEKIVAAAEKMEKNPVSLQLRYLQTLVELGSDQNAKTIIDHALRLEGVSRHSSTHACGVLITKDPLVENTPVQYASSSDKTLVSQYSSLFMARCISLHCRINAITFRC